MACGVFERVVTIGNPPRDDSTLSTSLLYTQQMVRFMWNYVKKRHTFWSDGKRRKIRSIIRRFLV